MWKYEKRLQYPVNIRKKNVKMAKYILEQCGGANGELAATLRYLNQRYTMPDDKGKAVLSDIATEEMAHMEIISTMLYQLLDGATPEELKENNLGDYYSQHGNGIYPQNSSGVPFTASYFAVTGDPLADIAEDMAAEQKARATYEALMNLTDDPDILGPLSFLRQREVIHYLRFKELYEDYAKMYLGDKDYLI